HSCVLPMFSMFLQFAKFVSTHRFLLLRPQENRTARRGCVTCRFSGLLMVRIHRPADKHHTWFQTETESPPTSLQGTARISCSLPHHLHDHPLVPLPVKLRIENPLPRPQVELACRDRHDYLMVNQQRLQVRIPVVL